MSDTETRIEYADGKSKYVGKAKPGILESQPLWKIQLLEYDATGLVSTKWAGGSSSFKFKWDDRASLSYS